MSGFYRMDYEGQANRGAGALALANGKVAGLDVGGGIYRGTYLEEAGQLQGTALLTFPEGGDLVTGMRVPPGAELPIPFNIPADASNHRLSVQVAGHRVDVLLTRVADL